MIPAWAQRISDLLAADPTKTPAGLARACGIKSGSVSGWFGKGKPTKMISGDNLVAAAAYLGVTPEYIMTGRGRSRSGDSARSVSESKETRLDPAMLAETAAAISRVYERAGKVFKLEQDPERFLQAYAARLSLPEKPSSADMFEFGLSVAAIFAPHGGGDGGLGRNENLPVDGGAGGNVARRKGKQA